MEAIDQDVMYDSHVEVNPVVEVSKEFSFYDNPLVEQHLAADTSFHFPMEGQAGSSS